MTSNLLLQPYARKSKPTNDNYAVTLSQEFDLVKCANSVSESYRPDLTNFLSAHPNGKAHIWALSENGNSRSVFRKINVGDLVLFHGNKKIYAYGYISSLVHWKDNNYIWPSGNNWDYIYSMREFTEIAHDIQVEREKLREILPKVGHLSAFFVDLGELSLATNEVLQIVSAETSKTSMIEIPVGALFANREEVRLAGLHKHSMAGIGYDSSGLAESIVVSGGYKDDEDSGDTLIYTGQGGQSSPGSGKQIADQKLERGNRALVQASIKQTPVRLIRGSGGEPKFSPKTGYRYDGLYVVKNYWWEKSTDGPTIIRFLLQQLELNQNVETETKSANLELPPMGNLSPVRKASTSTSVSRDSRIAAWVKNLYKDSCQICGNTIITQIGTYSEGAHIRPLGKPHDGHDTTENMLCLCPNCHATFDFGMLVIDIKERTWTDLAKGINGALNINVNHKPDPNFADYHRQHIAGLTSENR